MDALLTYWKDKYSPAELVEHMDISMDDLLFCLLDFIEENINDYREDIEEIYGYASDE